MTDTRASSAPAGQAWRERLAAVVALMRDMSGQADPEAVVRMWRERTRELLPNDGIISVSRRGLEAPWYKVSRASAWERPGGTGQPDPWREGHRLPLHDRGLLGELLYGDVPVLIPELRLSDDDPCRDLFMGAKSLVAIPQYDGGVGVNLVVVLSNKPNGFDPERFPDLVMQSGLFGRATSNLVLSRQLKEAYDALDRELKAVADMQRSLLPTELPVCAGLDLATHYQTSRNAGGDYYDFFDLGEHRIGILIADVSGHGTPAAVLMAILHAIAHLHPRELPPEPRHWMSFVNRQLCERYTRGNGTFVTAFYATYDGKTRELRYASAGHNPPRLRLANAASKLSAVDLGGEEGQAVPGGAAGSSLVLPLDQAQGLPLGIQDDWDYSDTTIQLSPGDVLTLYTDGITEAMNGAGELFGDDRLDAALRDERGTTGEYLAELVSRVETHAHGRPHQDDRTVVVARVWACDGGSA
ncbi:MAG TPA: PP2C family protein-serine/threonine phosphatase [Phycisphaerales bacterium]|nr:PP2C family protein-serine/threonine phosphatase [Phycisphaerales bacterium]